MATAITLLDHPGKMKQDSKNGWLNYWKPHEDAELGLAVLSKPENWIAVDSIVGADDEEYNHYYLHLKPTKSENFEFYSGFAWSKSPYVNTKEEWEIYLNYFSFNLENPLKVTTNF